MKQKLTSLLLALTILLNLTAVSVSAVDEGVLRVGYGSADVTPSQSAPLAGYGSTTERMSVGTDGYGLSAIAIAISDGSQTNLIMATDFIRVPTAWGEKAHKAIAQATGVSEERISISAIHTHSAPDIGDQESSSQPAKALTSDSWYFTEWLNGLVAAAEAAVADLTAVSATRISTVQVDGMNWIRHWRTADGHMNGVNFQEDGAVLKGHPRDTDRDMQVIRFVRSGEEKDVVLVNWQGHPTKASAPYAVSANERFLLSADYVGHLRRYVEEQDGNCRVAFFLGASGNVNGTTPMSDIENAPTYAEEYGQALGAHVLTAMEDMTTVETGLVRSMRLKQIVFNRGYASTREIEQDAVAIGKSIAFVTAGYEMFDINGMDVKQASPYQMTFVLTCTQGHEYMPSWETCWYPVLGGPEAYEAREAQFNEVPGTAEDLAEGLIGMLHKLYAN